MKTLYPNTAIREIYFGAASRGWYCDISYAHETHRQATYEHHTIRGYGPENWLGFFGMVASFINALVMCVVFAYRGRSFGGGTFNHESGLTLRAADWLVSLINERFGTIASR